jgi:phage-related tail protein
MPFRTLAFHSPEHPSNAPFPARGKLRPTRPSSGQADEVTRRVSLPRALDKAIEARRDLTGESRDEAIASLLRTAFRGGEEERPTAVTPDLGELSAVAVALSETATQHRAWLSEHHAALDETHRAASGAVADLREFAAATHEVRSGLSTVLSAVEGTAEAQRKAIAQALREATGKAQEQLDLAQRQVASAQAQISEFEEARSLHLEGLKGHIERYRRILRLTPTVAVSFVGVACVLAVVTSLYFVPTFQKFSEDEFVQRQIAPVVRDEIKKSFEVLRTEQEAQTKEFFALENERFEKFAAHYRKQIESLKGDKASLADENQKLIRAYNTAIAHNAQWEEYGKKLESENANLKKPRLERLCGSIGADGVGSTSLALLLLPLMLVLVSRYSRRKRV